MSSKRGDQPMSDPPSLTYRITQKKTPPFFFISIFLFQGILHVFPHANPTRFPSTDLSRATTVERYSVLSAPWREQPPYRIVPLFEHSVLSLIDTIDEIYRENHEIDLRMIVVPIYLETDREDFYRRYEKIQVCERSIDRRRRDYYFDLVFFFSLSVTLWT